MLNRHLAQKKMKETHLRSTLYLRILATAKIEREKKKTVLQKIVFAFVTVGQMMMTTAQRRPMMMILGIIRRKNNRLQCILVFFFFLE